MCDSKDTEMLLRNFYQGISMSLCSIKKKKKKLLNSSLQGYRELALFLGFLFVCFSEGSKDSLKGLVLS